MTASRPHPLVQQLDDLLFLLSSAGVDREILRSTITSHVVATARRDGLTPRQVVEALAKSVPSDEEWPAWLAMLDRDEEATRRLTAAFPEGSVPCFQ